MQDLLWQPITMLVWSAYVRGTACQADAGAFLQRKSFFEVMVATA
jgi:hypothetical protein